MEFIAILIALGLLQYWGSAEKLQKDSMFDRWLHYSVNTLENSTYAYLMAVVLPAFVLILVLYLSSHILWGLPELILYILLFLYALGRGDYNQFVESYCEAWETDQTDKILDVVNRMCPGLEEAELHDMAHAHVYARAAFIYHGFTRLFVILFWFVLLGPAVAVLYRLTRLYLDQYPNDVVRQIADVMEWPAGRLMGFTFAFVGDFTRGMASWLSTCMNASMSTRQVIEANALAALGFDMEWLDGKFSVSHAFPQLVKQARTEIREIKSLMSRSLVFAVFGIAFYQILV